VIQNYHGLFGHKNVAVSYLTIPDTGLGLFAKSRHIAEYGSNKDPDIDWAKVIPKGGEIDEYKGQRIEHFDPDVIKYFIQNFTSGYLYEVVPKHVVIDATDPESCYPRYANDNGDDKLNAELIPIPRLNQFGRPYHLAVRRGRGMLRALRDIYADEEIFCAYGENYWTNKMKR
jgi:SET domain-containing protein